MQNNLITVCARKGSKGLPGKNTKILHGKPLIEWTIDQALAWGKGDIVISTDDPQAAQIAWHKGVSVIMRPLELSGDDVSKFDVIAHVLDVLPDEYDTVIDLDVTNPMRTVGDIEAAYSLFRYSIYQAVVSVTKARKNPFFNQLKCKRSDEYKLILPSTYVKRQDTPDVWDMNASICVMMSNIPRDYSTPHVDYLGIYEMPDYCAFDIDTPLDWEIVEFLMEEYGPF